MARVKIWNSVKYAEVKMNDKTLTFYKQDKCPWLKVEQRDPQGITCYIEWYEGINFLMHSIEIVEEGGNYFYFTYEEDPEACNNIHDLHFTEEEEKMLTEYCKQYAFN